MSRFTDKVADLMTVSAAIGCSTCLFVLIAVIGLVKSCVTVDPDPMDHSINKSQQVVNLLNVVGSTGNGFCVHYATSRPVTNERYDEICSRPALRDATRRLRHDAPRHFGGSLLETDIYDFALFARQYDVTSGVHIDCIFVTGREKTAFYARPNPNLPDGVTRIDVNTNQGVQWIKHDDIYYYRGKDRRIYRYYKCPTVRAFSSTDERFTHFTEEERIH